MPPKVELNCHRRGLFAAIPFSKGMFFILYLLFQSIVLYLHIRLFYHLTKFWGSNYPTKTVDFLLFVGYNKDRGDKNERAFSLTIKRRKQK